MMDTNEPYHATWLCYNPPQNLSHGYYSPAINIHKLYKRCCCCSLKRYGLNMFFLKSLNHLELIWKLVHWGSWAELPECPILRSHPLLIPSVWQTPCSLAKSVWVGQSWVSHDLRFRAGSSWSRPHAGARWLLCGLFGKSDSLIGLWGASVDKPPRSKTLEIMKLLRLWDKCVLKFVGLLATSISTRSKDATSSSWHYH